MPNLNTSTSVVDYLKSKKLDSSFANRQKLATQYGITGYTGSGAQNSLLLSKLSGSTSAPTSSPTPGASPTSSVYGSSTNLYNPNSTTADYGNSNSAVLALQKSLNAQGANLALDSKYGDLTKAAFAKYGGGVTDFSSINSIEDANAIINAGQAENAGNATADGSPPIKSSFQSITDIMAGIKKATAPSTSAPEAPNYEHALSDFRSEYGINGLETQLTDLQAQARDIEAAFQVQKNAETGKPVAMNVIEGRVTEEQKVAMEKLTMINNSINTVNSQLTTKYNIVDSLMKAKQMDYTAASDLYDKEMTTNISMFNAAKGIDDANKTEIERAQDTARSNAQITLNALTATGTTYDTLTPADKINLTKMGVQSGLGADFFSMVLKNSAGKDILTTITSSDQTKATIIYKDGSSHVISTGLPAKATSGTDLSLGDQKINAFTEINMLLENPNSKTMKDEAVTTDGYFTPAGFLQTVKYGATKGITRDEIIGTYIDKFYKDEKTGDIAPSYGLTQKEQDKYLTI